jgi:hypothetical protein
VASPSTSTGSIGELDAQVDDRTIDNELNFDLEEIERRLETPEPGPLPLPPPPPAVLMTPPRPRSTPPPPPPTAFRAPAIGPAPTSRGGAAPSGSHEQPSAPVALATPPAQARVEDTIDTVVVSPSDEAPAVDARKPEKRGFFSKLFKKQS